MVFGRTVILLMICKQSPRFMQLNSHKNTCCKFTNKIYKTEKNTTSCPFLIHHLKRLNSNYKLQ